MTSLATDVSARKTRRIPRTMWFVGIVVVVLSFVASDVANRLAVTQGDAYKPSEPEADQWAAQIPRRRRDAGSILITSLLVCFAAFFYVLGLSIWPKGVATSGEMPAVATSMGAFAVALAGAAMFIFNTSIKVATSAADWILFGTIVAAAIAALVSYQNPFFSLIATGVVLTFQLVATVLPNIWVRYKSRSSIERSLHGVHREDAGPR